MEVKTITVVGAGVMGRGLALAAAAAGYRTVLEDISGQMLKADIYAYANEEVEASRARRHRPPRRRWPASTRKL